MAYEVIARKWRPQKFSDLVGQEHVAQTLKNAIMQGRIANAYLFVGTRGIGKTTSARIFAKALNCENSLQGEPCCECDSCISITKGYNLDVMEIDAASRNSVNDMRELANEVTFMPAKAKYKIYIIDEVHMLSAQAWNALLKTIEEPPAHAKFIFATTEAHKVLGTILSRCQRFDLRRIPTNLIANRLKEIAQAENVRISQKAIDVIARAADGGMRDAQSLLDQMISFFTLDTEISEEQVLSVFGLSSNVEIKSLICNILENNRAEVIANIYNLAKNGKNLEKLFEELLSFLRGIQISLLIKNPDTILECGQEMIDFYQEIAQKTDNKTIQLLLEVLSPIGYTLHNAVNKQVYLENLIFKAMRTAHAIQIDDILRRLNEVRKTGELTPLEAIPALEKSIQKSEAITITEPETVRPPQPAIPAIISEPEKIVRPPQPPVEEKPPVQPVVQPKKNEPIEEDHGVEEINMSNVDTLDLPKPKNTKIEKISEQENKYPEQEPIQEKIVVPPQQKKQFQVDKESPKKIWHSMIEDMKHVMNKEIIRNVMKEGLPESIKNGILNIVYDEEYGEIEILKKEISTLNTSFKRVSQDGVEVNIITKKGVTAHHHKPERNAMINEARTNEFVQDVLNLFNGEIIEAHG